MAYTWASDVAAADTSIPKELKYEIKKITLATAFVSDASLGALQMAARVIAFSVTARRNMWIHRWDADPSAHAKVMAVPFPGHQAFWRRSH